MFASGCRRLAPRGCGHTGAAIAARQRSGGAPIREGDSYSASRSFTEADISAFASLTHDNNPVHGDESFARGSRFGSRVVHGMLYASMFSAIVGQRYPGAVYVSQSLEFRRHRFTSDHQPGRMRRIGRLRSPLHQPAMICSGTHLPHTHTTATLTLAHSHTQPAESESRQAHQLRSPPSAGSPANCPRVRPPSRLDRCT